MISNSAVQMFSLPETYKSRKKTRDLERHQILLEPNMRVLNEVESRTIAQANFSESARKSRHNKKLFSEFRPRPEETE